MQRLEQSLTCGGGDVVSLPPDIGGDGDGGVGQAEHECADGTEELKERHHGHRSPKKLDDERRRGDISQQRRGVEWTGV